MTTNNLLIVACIGVFAGGLQAAPLIERDGRFEINYSTGKVRFYGASATQASDDRTWRPAEQRAWGEGLTHAEANLPQALASRAGSAKLQGAKLSKLSTSTTSINTTYFGDQKIKVLLEAPINAVIAQMSTEEAGSVLSNQGDVAGSSGLVLKVKRGTAPNLLFSVEDESGRELIRGIDLAASVKGGAPLPKWFKGGFTPSEGGSLGSEVSEISATSTSAGILRVESSAWKPTFASHFASGRVAVVVE